MSFKPYPEYKDSGVPWLDKLPKNWNILRAKNIFKCIDIRSQTGSEELLSVSEKAGVTPRKNVNVTMFQAASYIGYKLCWPQDLVINSLWAWKRGLGFSENHGIISTAYGVYRVKNNSQYNYHYLNYLLRSDIYLWEFRVNSKGIWRSRYQLTDDSLLCMPIIVPSINEQARITKFLDFKTAQIAKFIRNKKRMIALLKEKKQAIINQAVTRGLDKNVKLKPSGVDWLGDIPEHWEVLPIKRCATFNPSKKETGLENISERKVVFLPMEKVSVEGDIDNSQKKPYYEVCSGFSYFRKGDVVVAKITPCFENGKGAFLDLLETGYGFGTTEFITIRPGKNILGSLLRMLLSSKWFLNIGEKYMTGSAGQKRIAVDFIRNYIIGLPSIEEQNKIVSFIKNSSNIIDSTINRTEHEIELIQEYSTRLISDAVTGKIDVRDIPIEEFAEEENTAEIEDDTDIEDSDEDIDEIEDGDLE